MYQLISYNFNCGLTISASMLQNVMFMMFSCRLLKSSSLAILLTSTAAILKKITDYLLQTKTKNRCFRKFCTIFASFNCLRNNLSCSCQYLTGHLTTKCDMMIAPILLSCSNCYQNHWCFLSLRKKCQNFQECGYYNHVMKSSPQEWQNLIGL